MLHPEVSDGRVAESDLQQGVVEELHVCNSWERKRKEKEPALSKVD